MSDQMEVLILEDGTIKVLTGSVSGANHMQAEAFLRFVREYAGGEQTRARRSSHHVHADSKVHSGGAHE